MVALSIFPLNLCMKNLVYLNLFSLQIFHKQIDTHYKKSTEICYLRLYGVTVLLLIELTNNHERQFVQIPPKLGYLVI